LIETPSLDEYFKAESRNQSAIDPFQSLDFEQMKNDEEYDRIMEAEEEEHTYRKELMARMFGGKITSRQFGVLMNMSQDQRELEAINRKKDFKTEKEAQDTIRNAEELIETHRRKMVLNGECTEADSHQVVQAQLDEIVMKYPTRTAMDIAIREENKKIVNLLALRNSEQLMSREYYFDEGLGQSLNDHTAELKEKYPDMTVQTRRDRDGLPIVRI
jgi:hypothetical protein